jgi:S-adenosylmethionine synthetase
MNFTGSSIESGDEGMVGRGNRFGGLIACCRPFTMEGLGGKNPRYHVGKVYSAAAFDVAQRLQADHGISSNVFLVNRMAEPLSKPWFAVVETTDASVDERLVRRSVEEVLMDLDRITTSLVRGEYPLF